MLALSPQFCSLGWFLDMEDPMISHEQENLNYLSAGGRTENSDSADLHSPTSKVQPSSSEFASFLDGIHHGDNGDDNKTVKKLNHNASERDRRKRINNLYSTLRSLLPPDDQSKKLSIPVTVSRVLKYIPELQKEVEVLIQKKETLISKISRLETSSNIAVKNHRKRSTQTSSFPAVSATRISDREIIIQTSIPKAEKGSFSEAVINSEEEGFLVVNASCFESFGGRLFCNLHIQAQGSQVIDVEMLKEKVWPLHERERRGEILLT